MKSVTAACCHALPVGQRQHQAEMQHRHHVPAHATGALGFQGRAQLPRQLVTGKVKVHPGVGAAQHIHLKTTGHLQVGDVDKNGRGFS